MSIELYGYQYSVYSWIARLALHEKGIAYQWVELDPFSDEVPVHYLAMHPFKRVPTLLHGNFVLYETNAITRYIDEAFEGPKLQSRELQDRARMNQVLSIIDNYAYWPWVRQMFSHGFFRPRLNEPVDQSAYQNGLEAAPRVLQALNRIAGDSTFLINASLSLADIHLAPMIAYLTASADGVVLLKQHNQLSTWWSVMSSRRGFIETSPAILNVRPLVS